MKSKTILPVIAVAFLGLFLIFLWVGWAWFVTNKFPETGKVSETALEVAALRGLYGDMFGGVNALFTALLLAGAIYTIWIQQKQIESLKEQQIASARESNRSALLMATTALVNAKGILVSTRYQLGKDINTALGSQNFSKEWRPYLELMSFGNSENVGKDFQDLNQLANQLADLIDRTREER